MAMRRGTKTAAATGWDSCAPKDGARRLAAQEMEDAAEPPPAAADGDGPSANKQTMDGDADERLDRDAPKPKDRKRKADDADAARPLCAARPAGPCRRVRCGACGLRCAARCLPRALNAGRGAYAGCIR